MNLIKETIQSLGFSEFDPISYSFTVVGDRGGRFLNVKKILEVKKEKIVLALKKGEIVLEGDGLTLCGYSEGDIVVKGRIDRIGVNREQR